MFGRTFALCVLLAAIMPAAQDASKEEALLTAARRGDMTGVKTLVEGGVTVDAKNRYGITPLFYAVWSGHEEVAKYLIGKGADVNVRDTFYKMSILATAVSKQKDGLGKALVEAGSKDSASVLGMAASNGLTETVSAIIAKASPNEAQLKNAVQAAADKDDKAMVDLLRKAGAPEPRKMGVAVPVETMARYVGMYRDNQVGEMVIELTDGKLIMRAMGSANELLAYDATTFGSRSPNLSGMTFEFVVEGDKAKSVKIVRGPMTINVNRVEGK